MVSVWVSPKPKVSVSTETHCQQKPKPQCLGNFCSFYQYERQIESLVIPIIQIKLGNYGVVRYKTKIEVVLIPL